MDTSNGRKKWNSGDQDIQLPSNIPDVKDEVPPQYEHYLHLLQERNRLMRRLQKKNKRDIELEKKERGFTLYLNSSFSGNKDSRVRKDGRNQRQRFNSADQVKDYRNLQFGNQRVSKSASKAQGTRKNWNIGSVEFTTSDGQRQRIKAPEHLSGKYNDDFDSSSDSDDSQSEIIYSMSSLDIDNGVNNSTSSANLRRHKTSYLKRVVAAKRDETEPEVRLTIKLEDVKKLRESLQMNKSIRHSLAMETDSDVSDDDRVSPVCEEIEEEISSDGDNKGKNDMSPKPLEIFQPENTLVLEFQPLAATSANKSSRPLSANLRKSNNKADSTEEASEVIRALQEENKKVEQFSKTSSPRPLPQPKKTVVALKALTPTKLTSPVMLSLMTSPATSPSCSDQARPSNSTTLSSPQSTPTEDLSIKAVIEQVLKMNPRQQKQLFQTLNQIDVDEKSIAGRELPKSLKSMRNSWTSNAPVTDHFEVTLQVLSNWGHSTHVGLTELEFFDQSGSLIPVKPSDVSVDGVRGVSNKVEVLFNGKSKTTKERNMWSCKFDGRPFELSISMMNPNPGKSFQLGSVKVWNWNNKISNLDIGVREINIFFSRELLYSGEVDKGCGNQVFDYSKHIVFSNNNTKSQAKISQTKSGLSLPLQTATCQSSSASPSPRGSGKPLPSLISPSSASQKSLAKEEGNSLTSSKSHHTFRSISRSSQSSASSSGSVKTKSLDDGREGEKQGDIHIRSETRTLIHPTIQAGQRSPGSGLSSPEVITTDSDLSKIPEKMRAQTPKKTKRVAAILSQRSSETESSNKSVGDSNESKPPLPPTSKSSEKQSASSKSAERSTLNSTKVKLSPQSSRSEPHITPHTSSTSATTPTTQTPQNSSKQTADKVDKDQSLVDKIKNMSQSESKRKKDIPKWLKGEEAAELAGIGSSLKSSSGLPKKTSGSNQEDELQKQLNEEFERFSQGSNDKKDNPSLSLQEEKDVLIPMKKIEKSRGKWRNKEENLEESWGSLSFFNKSHRGRVSIDLGDDELDSYLNASKKTAPVISETAAKLPLASDDWSDNDLEFTIPELPSGKDMVINIKTTWGDHHYVGLTGLELFSSEGEKIPITKIWANPSDINILPEYKRDPRVITNIIDQVNRTRDDVHMWLAPFTKGNNHFIYLTFARPYRLALMRIWNYNKSRIHSYRGAKDVVISLDGKEIFKGEIARACGGIEGGTEAFGDTILFTTDENILESVSENDDAFEQDLPDDDEEDVPFARPSTADAEDDTRPFTRAAGLLDPGKNKNSTPKSGLSFVTTVGDVLVYKANKLELIFTATWGDLHYLGLTGLEVVGSEGETVSLTQNMITASPKDLRHISGNEKDDRTLNKLLDGTNITCLDSHMWLIPFTKGENHTVTITFPQQTLVTGVRIWNYNKSPEDTYRGAKVMNVQINDRTISPPEGYLLRKGPGVCHFDFAQDISFSNTSQNIADGSNVGKEQNQESAIQMPRGFIFQLQLFSTWGDQYYIGLNGVEFYDALFNKMELTETNIAAYPDSVNVLENISNDARTPDKLVDGCNNTNDGRHMWLAPILPNVTNRVYVIFDQPTSISMIKLWNYSKTVGRGVKDFALLVDDLLVYNGTLQGVSGGAIGIVPGCSASIPHHTILFTENKDIILKEKNYIISNLTEEQDIQLSNDKKIVSKFTKSTSTKPVNQALRPKTSVITNSMKR